MKLLIIYIKDFPHQVSSQFQLVNEDLIFCLIIIVFRKELKNETLNNRHRDVKVVRH